MNRRISTVALLAGLVLGVTGAWAAQSAAVGSRHASPTAKPVDSPAMTVRVRGTQVPVNPDKGTYAMRGDLLGRWTVIPAKTLHDTPTLYVESGLERFAGCLDRNHDKACQATEPHGVLRAAYIYWASFDGNGLLIRGQCVHPVTGGTLAFGGARGVVTMHDTPVGNAVRTTYRGRVVLRSAPPPATSTAPKPFDRGVAPTFDSGVTPTSTRRAC